MWRPRLEPRSLKSRPSGLSIVLRPQITSWNDLICLSKGLILQTFLTLETWRTRWFSPHKPRLIRSLWLPPTIYLSLRSFCTYSIYPRKKGPTYFILHFPPRGLLRALPSPASTYVSVFRPCSSCQCKSLRRRSPAWARAHAQWGRALWFVLLVSSALRM